MYNRWKFNYVVVTFLWLSICFPRPFLLLFRFFQNCNFSCNSVEWKKQWNLTEFSKMSRVKGERFEASRGYFLREVVLVIVLDTVFLNFDIQLNYFIYFLGDYKNTSKRNLPLLSRILFFFLWIPSPLLVSNYYNFSGIFLWLRGNEGEIPPEWSRLSFPISKSLFWSTKKTGEKSFRLSLCNAFKKLSFLCAGKKVEFQRKASIRAGIDLTISAFCEFGSGLIDSSKQRPDTQSGLCKLKI